MITLPIFFSLIFFTVFVIYLILGIYIFSLDRNSMKNRVFLALCLSLCVWSFAFSISNSAPDYGTALFWRRVAALGWGTVYSFMLHFMLIQTEKSRLLKKTWIYFLLYLPALVTVFAFSLNSDLVAGLYNLINTSFGWSNVSANSFWDWHFNIYYAGYTIACLGLLLHWGRRTKDPKNKKQYRLLIASLVTAFILGSMTDIIFTYLTVPVVVPQMAPVIILIPIAAFFYSIKRYGLMKSIIKSQSIEEVGIMSEASRSKFYQYLTITFILGSILNLISQYFIYQAPLGSVLFFSALLFLCGLFVQFICLLQIKENYKDTILFLLISLSIPLITLRFIAYASITVWAVPAIFVMLSVLFKNRWWLILLSIIILLTQIWVWIKVPAVMVQVEASDHFARIFIFSIIIFMAFYVNRVFIYRLEENEDQIRFQKMISQISADFVTVSESNLDEKVRKLLQKSGEHYKVDRTYLFVFSMDQKLMTYTHEWCNDGIDPAIGTFEEVSTDAFPWLMHQILNSGEIYIPNVEMLPPKASVERELLKKKQIQSLISIPVINKGKVLGFLGLDAVKNAKTWRDDHRESLKVLVNILADAMSKVAAEKEINRMAYYDALTGLPNRTLFTNRLIKEIHLAKRTEKFIGVAFIDLDSFKAVNDTLGHEGGDELLKQVACRFTEFVRKHDTVSRFGGDEFLIMLTNIARVEDISKITDKIMRSFEQPLIVKGQEFFVTASAGIAIYPTDGEGSEVLIKNADMAMYSSKVQGKNKYTLCSPVMKEDILKKMKLINSLYRAQERNELVLYYQPQVSVVTKKIIGLEALIRWEHPEMGMISPGIFIPLAEQTGLINPIGEWVLMTACRQNTAWQELGLPPVRMAVNLSVEQFRNPNLVSTVSRALSETGLRPEYLELEITESTAVKESGNIIQLLNGLKDLGVTIAIDDFGTEYSSLNRLKMLPIDRIKMDMQFVQGISKNRKDEAIAKVIIQLARSLELKVIAEGVETEPQLAFLTNQVCDEVQGYYYYKPVPTEEIEAILFNQLNEEIKVLRMK